jgi:cyclopropane fatty-acyl-phospholipid synthase-like methyltransferase
MTQFAWTEGWRRDPKHLAFTLSRYKFVSKMLQGFDDVLEIGAGDGWASEIVRKEVNNLTLSDLVGCHEVIPLNILDGPVDQYDAIYSLDVIEHINPEDAEKFLGNIYSSLKTKGVVIIGSPSFESQEYASEISKKHHVNCMTSEKLKSEAEKYFKPVFSFGMNDEVLHTGFNRMRHYNFIVGVK